jgi:hypothetical protein
MMPSALSHGRTAGYGVTVNPPARTALVPSGFVTLTSQTLVRRGPPLLAVNVAVMVWPFTTTTPDAVGEGPLPFSNDTVAPLAKPDPLMVTLTDVPTAVLFGCTLVIVTPTGGADTAMLTVTTPESRLPSAAW